MKVKIKTTKTVNIKYMGIDAGVRHWEDSEVNGESDVDLHDNPDIVPKMPFAVKNDKGEWRWRPVIDVETGVIIDWPKGTTANVWYKVCDDGIYTLMDGIKGTVVEIESYVPDCIGEGGDYLAFNIDGDGRIDSFSFGQAEIEEMIENAF